MFGPAAFTSLPVPAAFDDVIRMFCGISIADGILLLVRTNASCLERSCHRPSWRVAELLAKLSNFGLVRIEQ